MQLAYSCSGLLFLLFLPPDKPPTPSIHSEVLPGKNYLLHMLNSIHASIYGGGGFHITDSEIPLLGLSCLKPPSTKLHLGLFLVSSLEPVPLEKVQKVSPVDCRIPKRVPSPFQDLQGKD